MKKIQVEEFKLIGLSLGKKTTNENGRAGIDCGDLWQKFEKGDYANKIPNKLSDEVLAVYNEYDGDHMQPYSYFIGCKVSSETKLPEGMNSLIIPGGLYLQITVKGKIPACIINAWKEIWSATDITRAYQSDFEVYDERSNNWDDAVVDIFLSIKD